MNARLERVVINELRDDTFFAVLWLKQGDEAMTIDARPSDAIALALRSDCPIFVAEKVLQSAKLNTPARPRARQRSNCAAGSRVSMTRTWAATGCSPTKVSKIGMRP